MKRFTFKTEKPTGRHRSIYSDTHYIKLNGIIVGSIEDKYPHKINLMVFKKDLNEDGNPNCDFKWIKLKKQSKSLEEAKEFIRLYNNILQTKYKLYTGGI